jgi:hypothetical protein
LFLTVPALSYHSKSTYWSDTTYEIEGYYPITETTYVLITGFTVKIGTSGMFLLKEVVQFNTSVTVMR